MKIPTTEELFRGTFTPGFAAMPPHIPKYIYESMVKFTQIHVKAALQAASENIKVDIDEYGNVTGYKEIMQESILNAYPLENIK